MKFTGGYLLGATTVLGLAASFVGGIVAHELVMQKKRSAADKVAGATLSDLLDPWLREKKN
jgi:hypothetical protein